MTNNTQTSRPSAHQQRDALSQVTAGKPQWIDAPEQMLFTWLTFTPAQGEKPLFKSNSLLEIAYGLGDIVLGVSGTSFALASGPLFYPLIPLTTSLTVGGARHLVVEVTHMATHGSLFRGYQVEKFMQAALVKKLPQSLQHWLKRQLPEDHKQLNEIIGSAITILLVVDNFVAYRDNHVGVRKEAGQSLHESDSHHGRNLATEKDEDYRFVSGMGLKPNDHSHNQRVVPQKLRSLTFHWKWLQNRLKSNLYDASPAYRRWAWIWLAVLAATVIVTQSYLTFLLAWLLPITIGYQAAALSQLVTLHVWAYQPQGDETYQELQGHKTFNRILELMPPTGTFKQMPWAWLQFWFGKVPLRIWQRKVIYVGALSVHTYHHLKPNGEWGMNAIYAAEELRQKGTLGREIVGNPKDFLEAAWKSE